MADISDLPAPTKRTSVNISDLPVPDAQKEKKPFTGSEVPVPIPSVDYRKAVAEKDAGITPVDTPRSRKDFSLGEIGTAVAGSAAGGALLPELLRIGGGALGSTGLPMLSQIGKAASAMSPLVKGTRLSRAVGGAASAAIAEPAGQAYEIFDEPGFGAEATRFIVGGIPVSSFSNFATGKFGQFLRAATKEKFDLNLASAEAKKQKASAIAALGTPAGVENFDRLMTGIRSGVETDVGVLNARAAQISQQAEDFGRQLIQQGEQSAIAATERGAVAARGVGEKAKLTVAEISKQYEQRLSQFKMSSESEALKVLEESRALAKQLRDSAAGKAREQRSKMYQAADAIEKDTRNNVDEFLRSTDAEVKRLRSLLGKTEKRAQVSRGYVEESAKKIGTPLTETELGQAARGPAEVQFNAFKKIRSDQISGAEDAIFKAAKDLEVQGQSYQGTKAYADGVAKLNSMLIDPDTKRASITVPQLENQINNVLKAIKGKTKLSANEQGEEVVEIIPGNFQSLEYLRRFLGDRAAGVPAEGFDAIGQKMAGDLKKIVQNIQDEFVAKGGQSKPWTEYLDKYQKASKPINDYKSDLGQKLLNKTEWDASQYASDAAQLPSAIFKTHGSVEAYRALSGATDQELEKLGRQVIANDIFNKGASAGELLKRYSDILNVLPFTSLKQDLSNLAKTEELSGTRAKELIGKVRSRATQALKGALKTEEPIEKILTSGAEDRAKAVTDPRKNISATITEGTKAAEKQLTTAEKEAARLRGEIPKEEKRVGQQMRGEQKQVGREAVAEQGVITSAAKVESKEAIASAKKMAEESINKAGQEAKIPQEQANALKSAIDKLGDTPANAFKKMVFGEDPVKQLTTFAPYIKNTPQGLDDFQKGVIEGLVFRSRGSIPNLLREWDTVIKPAIVGSGLMTEAAATKITRDLTGLMSVTEGKVKQLSFIQNIFANMIRNGIQVPMSALRYTGVLGDD